jgi:glyoxylase-like metal-dependent hydrolase (beta-lactamase superfamily II)/8-oxo-dGTP pyrophosphatase MutT (NUDIX family)
MPSARLPSADHGGEMSTEGPLPRPAATVALLRDGLDGLEVLLTVRRKSMAFMGGATVFPGGAVSSGDLDPRWADACTISPRDAASALGMDDEEAGLAAYVCAIRETFEEVGLLLATGPVERIDRGIAADSMAFVEACIDSGVTLATDRLAPAGRWVTPLGSAIRFDALFFLATAPDGFEPVADAEEVERAGWAAPSATLDEFAKGRAVMAPPTVEMLERLNRHRSSAQALASFEAVGSGQGSGTRLSPLVKVVVAPNPSAMTGPGTNTYVVGSGPYWVIDPAVDEPGFLDEVWRAAHGSVGGIAVTHRHSDHVGGVASLSARSAMAVRAWGRAEAGGVQVEPLEDGDRLEVPGAPLNVLHTPGHASDHVCFMMASAASLFSGDTILGEGTSVIAPPDGDMAAYLESLKRLRELPIDRIYPGHWPPLDGGAAVIDHYIAHRHEREALILDALSDGPVTVDDIVARAYGDTPLELHPIARYSAVAHLKKLETEKVVRESNGKWSKIPT